MKNIFITSILFFSFLFSFGQTVKKYSITEVTGNETPTYSLRYGEKNLPIRILFKNSNYFFFIEKDTVYKIELNNIDLSKISDFVSKSKDYNNLNDALVRFSGQAQTGLAIQLIAPCVLFIKNEASIYGAIGLSLLGTALNITSYNHLKKFTKIDKAIIYPY